MPSAAKPFLLLGSLLALAAVMVGAFGAHALRNRVSPELLAVFQTGVQYHFYHALGVLVVGLACFHLPDSAALRASGWLMMAGILFFSGSLYLLALTGARWFGAVAPIGGSAFMLGWATLAWAVWKAP